MCRFALSFSTICRMCQGHWPRQSLATISLKLKMSSNGNASIGFRALALESESPTLKLLPPPLAAAVARPPSPLAHRLLWVAVACMVLIVWTKSLSLIPRYPSELDEAHCQYISSRGILKSCDVHDTNPISGDQTMYQPTGTSWESLPEGALVYVNGAGVKDFFLTALPRIRTRFVLVSGDSILDMPFEAFGTNRYLIRNFTAADWFTPPTPEMYALTMTLLNDHRVLAWYTQNLLNPIHTKLRQLPLGLDYHSLEPHPPLVQEAWITRAIAAAPPLSERALQCYANFHFLIDTKYGLVERTESLAQVPPELLAIETTRVERKVNFERMTQYAFVLSPPGGGYDCHRTWEALILGSIPIIKSSALDPIFADLPVLIVKNWTDVNATLLRTTRDKFASRTFPREKLTLQYWMNSIREESRRLVATS